ncbi:ABC transporter permease subunit, partial [Escherichia coli]|nr:ABC transporter permease subunit [Escherichia coli]
DVVLSRIIDVTIAFPFFVLVIAIVGLMGPGLTNYFVALALVSWVSYARLVRAQTAILRDKDYVLAAKVLGFFHSGHPRTPPHALHTTDDPRLRDH